MKWHWLVKDARIRVLWLTYQSDRNGGIHMDKILDVGPLAMDKTNLKRNMLAGEVAVITGGAGNVGLGTARSLAWLGAKVVIADVTPEPGKAAEKLINGENGPGTALFVLTDVSNEASMKAMAQAAFNTFGRVDILVNNAMAMSLGAPILKSTVYQLDRQYEIAARGTLIGIQLFVPGMQGKAPRRGYVYVDSFQVPGGTEQLLRGKSGSHFHYDVAGGGAGTGGRNRYFRLHVPSSRRRLPPQRGSTASRFSQEFQDARHARLRRKYSIRGRRSSPGLLYHPGYRAARLGSFDWTGFPANGLAVSQAGDGT